MDSHFINFIKIIMVKCAINTLTLPLASSFWLGGWVTTKVDRWTGGQVDSHFINLIKIIMDCNDNVGQAILCQQEKLPGRRSKLCPGSLFST